ncbi:MAG: HesA/MoeB/ThiF family protein [Desulfurococcaceae archaeon]|jgi:molybdopterin/thiamine biosynthesis adenylyltransferase
MKLSEEELERYDRQIKLLGVEAQEKLKKSKVLIVGVGGLGSPAALYLTAAGIGELILVDFERVELSNLNRQILYWTRDVGRIKVEAAFEKLRELNPNVNIRTYPVKGDEKILDALVEETDLVIDGLDNWETRFTLNKLCVKHRKPFIHAGVLGFYGQLLVVVPGVTPCLQCIMPMKPRETRAPPVIGTTPGVMALLQVTEAIKILTGYGKPALGKLIVYNGYELSFSEVNVSRNPQCPVCSYL